MSQITDFMIKTSLQIFQQSRSYRCLAINDSNFSRQNIQILCECHKRATLPVRTKTERTVHFAIDTHNNEPYSLDLRVSQFKTLRYRGLNVKDL